MHTEKRQFWVILIVVFIGFVGISMPYLIFPALFLNPGYSILPAGWGPGSQALFLGLTLAAYPFGQFIGSPILGALSDDYGRKQLLSSTLLLSGLCNLATGFAIEWHQLELLILSRLGAGFMEGNIAIARAMATDLKSIPKPQSLGRINAAISTAYLLGPFLGGLLADKNLLANFTTSTPFYCICVLFFCLAVLSVFVLEKSVPLIGEVKTVSERINFIKRMATLFTNQKLQLLILISTSFTVAVDIFFEFAPVYLTVKWGLGPPQLIFYNGVLCFGLVLGNAWLPNLFAKQNRLAILGPMAGFALLLCGIALANSTVLMMILFGLSGISIGLAVTLLTVKISDSASDRIQGEVMGVQTSLRVLGDALICLFGSALLLLSSKIILIAAAAIAATAMIYFSLKAKN